MTLFQSGRLNDLFLANGVEPEAVARVFVVWVHRDESPVLSVHGDTDWENVAELKYRLGNRRRMVLAGYYTEASRHRLRVLGETRSCEAALVT